MIKKLNAYWILLLVAPLPLICLLFYYSARVQQFSLLDERMEALHEKKQHADQIQRRQHSFVGALAGADPLYIDKHLESLIFLESEVKKLETQMGDEAAARRLHFLKEGENRLLLSEEKMRTKDKMREVVEKMQHPVEIHEEDLKKLLCLIEGVTIWPYGPKEGRPQLLFQDFHLTRTQQPPSGAIFSLHFNMIKRENLSP